MSILGFLIVGIIAGWLAGLIMKGSGFGLIGDMVVGILGALIGGFLFDVLGVWTSSGFVGSLITSLIGALVLLFLVGLCKKK